MSQSGEASVPASGSILTHLTGNSGGAVSPTANNINTVGSGSITIVGNPGTSTLTTQVTGLTNHAVLVGAGTDTITKVGPASLSGLPLVSQGATSDPVFQANIQACRPIESNSNTTYTLALTDANTWQLWTAGGPTTITVPLNATIAFPIATEIEFFQQGGGQITFAAALGVTIQSQFGSLSIAAQYGGAFLKYLGSDTWALIGSLS